MYSESHILVANILYDYLKNTQGITLHRESFLTGNTVPDFSSYAVIHPHFPWFSYGYIRRQTKALAQEYLESAEMDREYSKQLGILCHYYTDFFCFAHTRSFRKSVVSHVKYENLLHNHFLSRLGSLPAIRMMPGVRSCPSADELNERLRGYYGEYLSSDPSFDNDIFSALHVCAELAVSLFALSCRQKVIEAVPFGVVRRAAVGLDFRGEEAEAVENRHLYGYVHP